jgi:hypothetical protein
MRQLKISKSITIRESQSLEKYYRKSQNKNFYQPKKK